MAIPHAYPGMPVDLRPAEESLSEARTIALVKNNSFIERMIPDEPRLHLHQRLGPGSSASS